MTVRDHTPAGQEPIAHAIKEADGAWRLHALGDHLHAVSTLAAGFAAPFGAADWASVAGRWHDLGKFRPAFQRYIRTATGLDAQHAHLEGVPG